MKLNFQKTIARTDWLLEKIQNNREYAVDLYRALCNNDLINKQSGRESIESADALKQLIEDGFYQSFSWRSAGDVVAELRDCKEDYLDFYCSGGEGIVSEQVRNDLDQIGWIVVNVPDNVIDQYYALAKQ